MNHEPIQSFISCLMHGSIVAHVLHWKTENRAEHKALAKLYEHLDSSMDTYAETYMGIYGRFGDVKVEVIEITTANELIVYLTYCVASMRETLPNDTQLQNIMDEIAAGIDRVAYLLTLK
jgi:hypothetical protein